MCKREEIRSILCIEVRYPSQLINACFDIDYYISLHDNNDIFIYILLVLISQVKTPEFHISICKIL